MNITDGAEEIFWSKVSIPFNLEEECWEWIGADRGNGYGLLSSMEELKALIEYLIC